MKKILLLIGALALPMASFAQGTVNFANNTSFPITTNSPALIGGTGASGQITGAGQFRFGLYVSSDNFVTESLAGTALNGNFTGRFNGGSDFPVPNNNGTQVGFQVRGWTAAAGSTYAQAVAAAVTRPVGTTYAGQSARGFVTPATGLATSPNLFGVEAGQVGGFALELQPVPEPSTIALGLLGLGAVAMLRRRK